MTPCVLILARLDHYITLVAIPAAHRSRNVSGKMHSITLVGIRNLQHFPHSVNVQQFGGTGRVNRC